VESLADALVLDDRRGHLGARLGVPPELDLAVAGVSSTR